MTVDRRLLPHTFGPWFARFPALTEVQEQAIPPILEGHDVLICSATASGKTEAYAAPAAELVRREGGAPLEVVIVAPTRALTNDLKRRLEGPLGLVEVTLGRYTGEHKERTGGRLPSVAIVTPEALDSLLARRPAALAATRMVVLDEVQILDNTTRGDQLRVLLHRLERVADRRPQRVAASATIDRPEELGARYLVDPRMVVVPGARRIRGRAFAGSSPAAMAAHLDELAAHGFKKVLAFCRSRNQVETYAAKLRGKTRFGASVFAHHGSLARDERERTERLFQQAPAAAAFATLTLEMGIDIGTVDYVVLAALPADVSSLLQRIGRGGRRGDSTRCGYVVDGPTEEHLFRVMFRLGKEGRLCGSPYGFRPSVVVQQALVLACAGTYLERAELERALPPAVHAELGPGACAAILEQMLAAGLLERAGAGRFVPSEEVEQRFGRGTLHSNLQDTPGVEVVDRITGDILGSVSPARSSDLEIGGRSRKIVKATEGRVLTDAAAGAEPAYFRPRGSPSVSFSLARAVVESLDVDADAIGLIEVAGETLLLHGLGTVGALLLLELLGGASASRGVRESSPYTLRVARAPESLPLPDEAELSRFVGKRAAALAKLVGVGPWERGVPEALRVAAVRRYSGLDEVVAFLRVARLQRLDEPDPAAAEILREL